MVIYEEDLNVAHIVVPHVLHFVPKVGMPVGNFAEALNGSAMIL